MKTEKGTIQHFMENNFPDHFANGKWGCCKLYGDDAEPMPEHGFQVGVGLNKNNKTWYWVWLDKD